MLLYRAAQDVGMCQSEGLTSTTALHSPHLLKALLGQLTAAGGGLHCGTATRRCVSNPALLGLLSCPHSLQEGQQDSGNYTAQAVLVSSKLLLG